MVWLRRKHFRQLFPFVQPMYYDPHSPTENETNLKHLMNVGFDKYFHKLINSATRKPIKSMFVLSIANGLGCVCGDKIKKNPFKWVFAQFIKYFDKITEIFSNVCSSNMFTPHPSFPLNDANLIV